MSELQTIQAALERAAKRHRWQTAWRGFWQGLFAGALLWLAALIAYKIFPLPVSLLLSCAGLAALIAAAGFVRGWWHPKTLAETARWIDRKQKLQERLSTALEVAQNQPASHWRDLLVSDAAVHAQKLDPRRLLPFHLPAVTRWTLAILALCVSLGFVPEYRSKSYLQKQQEKAVIKEVGQHLADLTRRNLEHHTPALEPTRQNLETVEQLGTQLNKAPLTQSSALKDLASVTEKLKDQLKELGRNPALKPLERAARESSRNANGSPAEMQKQIESLQKALGNKPGTPESLDKLKDDLAQAQKAAAGMPAQDTPEGQAAKQQMAQTLADLAKQAREMGESLPNLDEAIAALQANQTDLMMKDLNLAMTDLDKLAAMSKELAKLQQAASRLGKDLAEQLQNGQAEQAQQTLTKMSAALKSANLSPDQMNKVLEEVSKALDPAGKYGKVADLLKQSVGQMKQGDKPQAAQSLADAAKELQKLMDQMGDAQALMASLDALKKAQLCVGNCTSWGQCDSGGISMKPSGKPGSGVGTWADENTGWSFYTQNETKGWDNSGLERPDIEGRGITDRGDAERSDALIPTKVRGQISPGGPMPSITLKGLSIKGQSSVGYTEAVAAAQSDAQSAISQDQVPRAYRGAVRDYFDDLKK